MQSHLARVLLTDAQSEAYLGILAFLQIGKSRYLMSTVLKGLIPLRMFQVHKVAKHFHCSVIAQSALHFPGLGHNPPFAVID